MSVWICLVCASLLSCAGQLCQKQATRPSRRGRRSRHILFWLGMALLCLGCGMLLWLSVLQSIPVSIAYPMLSLNFVWVTLAGWGIWHEPVARRHWLGVGLIVVELSFWGPASDGLFWALLSVGLVSAAQLLLRSAMVALPPLTDIVAFLQHLLHFQPGLSACFRPAGLPAVDGLLVLCPPSPAAVESVCATEPELYPRVGRRHLAARLA
nr:Undecaprenyl phosphate-aminoarabinose flippase subunit ArnE [Klebsiella pneumoniae]